MMEKLLKKKPKQKQRQRQRQQSTFVYCGPVVGDCTDDGGSGIYALKKCGQENGTNELNRIEEMEKTEKTKMK
ncbi:hypothetical protein DERF_001033 [Dermatophagoides farinae]|uniref:Uncharacterized protein n=1 Tax=Dermatophagoides farinae TaxID=6954 RepID=A0A922I8N9_DERFA|nr:hypothetical protein DERF_001033 [Dermatophagoides farinae]